MAGDALFDALIEELTTIVRFEPVPSRRGREVLYHRVVLGSTNAEIARELGISVKTVEAHLRQSAERLGRPSVPRMVRELLEDYVERKVRARVG